MHVVTPRSFNDAQQVADEFKRSKPVIINLQSTDRELSKRLIDFSSGMTYALGGGMQRISQGIFLLRPRTSRSPPRRRPACSRAASSTSLSFWVGAKRGAPVTVFPMSLRGRARAFASLAAVVAASTVPPATAGAAMVDRREPAERLQFPVRGERHKHDGRQPLPC